MNVPIEEKRAEAVSRMKKLGIFPETIRQFERDGKVSISEPPFGAFYWAEGSDLESIREVEEKYGGMVYMVVRSYFPDLGKMDSYLWVSNDKETWEYDAEDLADNIVFAYVYNHDFPDFSEFGSIGVERTQAAGLRRVF